MSGTKLRVYNLNKFFTFSEQSVDCVHTSRVNISIPQEFTFCYRHKPAKMPGHSGLIFIGNLDENWKQTNGFVFGIWNSGPWLDVYEEKSAWVALGTGGGIPFLLAWRHTCLTINLIDGQTILYENGKLQFETQSDYFFKLKDKIDSLNMISLGCIFRKGYKTIGPVTDFQLFNRTLSKKEMEEWTGCTKSLDGEIVNWDSEEWVFNKTGKMSEVEKLEFESNICDLSENSKHIIPVRLSFTQSLGFCEKLAGTIIE